VPEDRPEIEQQPVIMSQLVSVIPDLDITVSHDEIRRLLGYDAFPLPARVQAIIREIEGDAASLLAAVGAYRLMKKNAYAHSGYLGALDEIALCLVTIGPNLESAVSRCRQAGDLSRAIILDCYGSAAAEAAAEKAEMIILKEIRGMGLHGSRRFSPGYGGWDVAEQAWVLSALDAAAIGVRLTTHCMMIPRKSVTFALAIGESPVQLRDANVCSFCGMVDCHMRHTTRKCFGGRKNDE
jgi:hypothetical protein